MEDEVIIPEVEVEVTPIGGESKTDDKNLAGDADLCTKVLEYVGKFYEKYSTGRDQLREIWDAADMMVKCGQNETVREVERGRTDRNSSDNNTKTKSQKVGSTLFHNQVRTLAAFLVELVSSQKDLVKFRSRYNPSVWSSPKQAEEQADNHQTLMRWQRDADCFDVKFIELAWQLFTYGNIPVYSYWLKKIAEVVDRVPVEPGQKPIIQRRNVPIENRPEWAWIDPSCFYADQNIADIQQQPCILVKSQATIQDFRSGAQQDAYLNVDKIGTDHLYRGGELSEDKETRETSEGYSSTTDDTETGTFVQWDIQALLPIDESKPKGKRWDVKKHDLKRFWVTVCTSERPQNGVCLRIIRNPDPDDEYPIEMISVYPFDKNKLWKFSPAQVVRGNYTELTTTKQQSLDRKTLQNNRPLKIKTGAVRAFAGGVAVNDLSFAPDKRYECDDPDRDIKEFELDQIAENPFMLSYLESDTDKAIGTNRIMRGEAMGGRTSSNEAEKAYQAGSRPHFMVAKYILHKLLRWYVRKMVRMWHVYADERQVLQITDNNIIKDVKPAELFGEFDIDVSLVDEYEQNVLQRENFTYAAQTILPLFQDVLNLPYVCKKALKDTLNWDDPMLIKPDMRHESQIAARIENRKMVDEGVYVPVTQDEDYDAMLAEHEGERVKWLGIEDTKPTVQLLDRHIEETKMRKSAQPRLLSGGTAQKPPENTTEGMAAGNEIAARMGAQEGVPGV